MKSSQFVDAVHLLVLLVLKRGVLVTSHELARSLNAHPVVVRRILRRLAENGLVETQEGAAGGFVLEDKAEWVSLRDAYEAVELDPLFALPTREPNPDCPVGSRILSALKPTLKAAELALCCQLGETTLADVLRSLLPGASPRPVD